MNYRVCRGFEGGLFLVKMDGGLDVYDNSEWLASLTNLLFVNKCLEGGKKKDWLQTTRQTGMETQMRETEIPKIKNQEETRKPNGSKETPSCYYSLP